MKYQMKRERFRENIKLQKRHFYSHRYLDDCSWVLPVCMYAGTAQQVFEWGG